MVEETDTATEETPEVEPVGEPHPDTAGEESHEDVDQFRGEEAGAPEDAGRPAEESL